MTTSPLTTEHALLGFLHEAPMHGYEIHRRLSESAGLGLVWRVKQNQLYALLNKLEGQDYVSAAVELQENRPPRKIFRLTPLGREAFLRWVQMPVERGKELRLDFLAKLFFARREGAEVTQTLIKRQRQACRTWLAEQQHQAEGLRQTVPYDWLVYQFRAGQIEAMLAWLNTCEQVLPVLDR